MAKTSPYPFCVDCYWLADKEQIASVFAELDPENPVCNCSHWCTLPDPVTGALSRILTACEDRRGVNGKCGLEGRLFEAKGSPSMTVDWSNPDRPHITIDFSAEAKETE